MATRTPLRPAPATTSGNARWHGIRSKVHAKLLQLLTPDQLRALNKDGVREQLGIHIERIVREENIPLTQAERDRLIEEVLDEVFGLGPLEILFKDPTISDIMVNGPDSIYVERNGKVVETEIRFKDQAHLRMIIDRIVSNIGRRIDDSSPIVDARLPDGSRMCAVIPPLSLIGPVMSIRRFGKRQLTIEDLLKLEAFTPGMYQFLAGAVRARLNVVVSGGSGSGKTTMLNTLSRFIPEDERIVTIEDTAELTLQQEHVVRLETRPMNIEGAGAITQRDLVINAAGDEHGPRRVDDHHARQHRPRCVLAPRNHGDDGQFVDTGSRHPADAGERRPTGGPLRPTHRRHPQDRLHRRGRGHRRRSREDGGYLPVRPAGHLAGGARAGLLQGHRLPAERRAAHPRLRYETQRRHL